MNTKNLGKLKDDFCKIMEINNILVGKETYNLFNFVHQINQNSKKTFYINKSICGTEIRDNLTTEQKLNFKLFQ